MRRTGFAVTSLPLKLYFASVVVLQSVNLPYLSHVATGIKHSTCRSFWYVAGYSFWWLFPWSAVLQMMAMVSLPALLTAAYCSLLPLNRTRLIEMISTPSFHCPVDSLFLDSIATSPRPKLMYLTLTILSTASIDLPSATLTV